jgi:hypothetical protein
MWNGRDRFRKRSTHPTFKAHVVSFNFANKLICRIASSDLIRKTLTTAIQYFPSFSRLGLRAPANFRRLASKTRKFFTA